MNTKNGRAILLALATFSLTSCNLFGESPADIKNVTWTGTNFTISFTATNDVSTNGMGTMSYNSNDYDIYFSWDSKSTFSVHDFSTYIYNVSETDGSIFEYDGDLFFSGKAKLSENQCILTVTNDQLGNGLISSITLTYTSNK